MENQELTQNNPAYAIGEKTNGKGNDGLNSPAKSSAETTNAKNVAAKPAQKKKKSNDEFRRKYFGEDEKTAKKIIEQAEKERK